MLSNKELNLVLVKEDIETIVDMELDENEFQEIVQAWGELPPYDEISEVIREWFDATFSYTIMRRNPKSFAGKSMKSKSAKKKKPWYRRK